MKKLVFFIAGLFVSNLAFSQEPEMKTLFKTDTTSKSTDTWGGYGAPFVGVTQFNGNVITAGLKYKF